MEKGILTKDINGDMVIRAYKQRTDKCKKYFKQGLQIGLLEGSE